MAKRTIDTVALGEALMQAIESVVGDSDFSEIIADKVNDALGDTDFSNDVEKALRDMELCDEDRVNELIEESVNEKVRDYLKDELGGYVHDAIEEENLESKIDDCVVERLNSIAERLNRIAECLDDLDDRINTDVYNFVRSDEFFALLLWHLKKRLLRPWYWLKSKFSR